jgi:hypothetical protein
VLKGDTREARALRHAYLEFAARRLAWYRDAGRALFGRQPALVMLLHASRLNADVLPDLLDLLRHNEVQFATLDRVMSDPAYRLPDGPATADGDDWFNRWARVLHKDLPWDAFPEPPAAVVEASRRLDPEP